MTKLPAAVQQAADQADQLQTQIAGKRASGQAAHMQVVPRPDPLGGQPPHEAAQGGLPAQQPPGGTMQPDQGAEYWKHRFTSMKAYHDQVVPQLRQQNAQLQADVDRMNREGQSQSQHGNPAQVAPVQLTDEQLENIGAENVGTVQQIVQQQVGNVSDAIQQQFKAEREKENAAKWSSFQSELASMIPNYLAINAMPGWNHYLASTIDPATGVSKQAMLDSASAAFDARSAALIFQDFQQVMTQQVNPYQQPQMPDPFAQQQGFLQQQVPVQQIPPVNPAMPRTPSQPIDAGAGAIEMWDRTEIDAFWADYRKFVSTPGAKDPARAQQYEETVLRIQAAEAEGRVDQTR